MPSIHIPNPTGTFQVEIERGASLVILGANGSGKTRLGVWIETTLGANADVHRIGAHRSLMMNTKVLAPSYEIAERRLFFGFDQGEHQHRVGHRWGNKPATVLLTDFDHVLSALYADENRTSVLHRQAHLADPSAKPPVTKLDRLKVIWQSILPHRELIVLDANVQVQPTIGTTAQYDASELSDGERVIFYLIGQVLLTKPDSLVIVDEPDLHINRSILANLWDAIEAARDDCSFIYLTHDLEFTTSRRTATKYFLHSYIREGTAEQWEIEPIPVDTGIPENVITKIVGSRQPILFVEGDGGSLDSAIYRRVYDSFTTIPVGSSDDVIHSVASFRAHAGLHWLGCAGLIDADGRDPGQVPKLASGGVHVLPVSEVENLLLLPNPFLALAKLMQFDEAGARQKLSELQAFVLSEAKADADRFSINHTRRHIDAEMKVIGLSAKSIADLVTEFKTKTSQIDTQIFYDTIRKEFEAAADGGDYETILKLYDNKGLLSEAAKLLGAKGRRELEEFVGRALPNNSGKELLAALIAELPSVAV